jgi:hypothetical protein
MSACGRRGLRCFAGSAHVSLRLPLAEPFWGDVGPCQPATVHSPDRLMSAFGFHSPSPFGETWGHVSLRLSIRRIGSCQPSASTRRALLGRRGAMSACDCPFAGSAHVSLRLPLAEPFWEDVGPCQPATVHSPDRLMSAFGFHSPSPFGETWGHVSLRLSIRRIGSCQPSASTRRALLGRRGAEVLRRIGSCQPSASTRRALLGRLRGALKVSRTLRFIHQLKTYESELRE